MEKNTVLEMDDDTYFALEGYASSSVLKVLYRKSARHLLNKKKNTQSLSFGKMNHCQVLENDQFNKRYIVEPEFKPSDGSEPKQGFKNTKDYQNQRAEFLETANGRQPVPKEEYDLGIKMLEAIHNSSLAHMYDNGIPEAVILFDYNGIPCKIKIDWLNIDHANKKIVAVDYKTCDDASEKRFSSLIYWGDGGKGDYNIQAAFYIKGIELAFPGYDIVWLWNACEKSDNPQSCWYGLSEKAYCDGIEKVDKALNDYAPIMIDCYSGYRATEEVVWL